MGKQSIFMTAITVIILLLAGCQLQNIDELYQLPQQAEEHLQLQQEIESILDGGAEYSSPISGMNRQSVQYVDIDGDGISEALVFFRDESKEKPLNIFIFKENDEAYEVVDIIQEDGTAIHSISYADLNGDGVSELIVGWALSEIQMLSVYNLKSSVSTKLFSVSFSDYLTYDLSGNGQDELIVLDQQDSKAPGRILVYTHTSNDEFLESSVQLSYGFDEVVRIVKGNIQRNMPGLIVESKNTTSGEIVSDVIALTENGPKNLTLRQGVSRDTVRSQAYYSRDIDNDGRLEIPITVALKEAGEDTGVYYAVRWYNIGIDGKLIQSVVTTYHNNADSWYLVIPDQWLDTLAVWRNDLESGERAVYFSMVEDDNVTDFLIIYTLTGDNKSDRAELPGRFILESTDSVIYAAEILDNLLDSALTESNIQKSFSIIVATWDE